MKRESGVAGGSEGRCGPHCCIPAVQTSIRKVIRVRPPCVNRPLAVARCTDIASPRPFKPRCLEVYMPQFIYVKCIYVCMYLHYRLCRLPQTPITDLRHHPSVIALRRRPCTVDLHHPSVIGLRCHPSTIGLHHPSVIGLRCRPPIIGLRHHPSSSH